MYLRQDNNIDILLLLEGTFPYVTGGVSSWVNQLIRMFSQYRFGAIFLGSRETDYKGFKYQLPDNLVHLEVHYLFTNETEKPHLAKCPEEKFAPMRALHDSFRMEKGACPVKHENTILNTIVSDNLISEEQFLYSQASWEYILKMYEANCPEIAFMDYFWCVRNMHIPIWKIISIAKSAPKPRLLHSISTGYAGMLGALIKHEYNCPYILSEHGIYVKERRIDLLSGWCNVDTEKLQRELETQSYVMERWIEFFEVTAKIAYFTANPIVSLFGGYRAQQIADGADPEKTLIVPNGVPFDETKLPAKSAPAAAPLIALIGRVVSIKDIKTFIRSIVVVLESIPDAQVWIIGPVDEDEAYVTECRQLIEVLNLAGHIRLTGTMKIAEVLPKIDLIVLSSISEGLPLVMLEGFAAGIPAVTTDVGSCRELIEGNSAEDKALGTCGLVVEISNADALAKGIVTMLTDTPRWQQAQQTALKRLEKYYSEKKFKENYTHIYEKLLNG